MLDIACSTLGNIVTSPNPQSLSFGISTCNDTTCSIAIESDVKAITSQNSLSLLYTTLGLTETIKPTITTTRCVTPALMISTIRYTKLSNAY